jgi:hypothetical protein
MRHERLTVNELTVNTMTNPSTITAGNVTATTTVTGANVVTGDLTINSKKVPVTATFTIAAGAANVCGLTITLKDADGVALDNAAVVDVWLSAANTGLTAGTAPSTGFAATTGQVLLATASKLAIRALSNASGSIVLTLTDTGKTAQYVAVGMNGVNISVSRVLASGDYGA